MPGARAAVQSSRCGKIPKEPWSVRATIRFTPSFSAKIWKGRRILRLMGDTSLKGRGLGFPGGLGSNLNFGFGARISSIWGLGGLRFFLGLVDRTNHVKGALGIVLELIVQNALTAVERVLQADVLSLDAAELLGREKRLGQKALQPAGATDNLT